MNISCLFLGEETYRRDFFLKISKREYMTIRHPRLDEGRNDKIILISVNGSVGTVYDMLHSCRFLYLS